MNVLFTRNTNRLLFSKFSCKIVQITLKVLQKCTCSDDEVEGVRIKEYVQKAAPGYLSFLFIFRP